MDKRTIKATYRTIDFASKKTLKANLSSVHVRMYMWGK